MNTEMLKLASSFAARTDTRCYLNSVYVTPTCIVASDGSRLIKINCDIDLPDNIQLILDINDVLRFIKAIPKKLHDKHIAITKIDSMTAKLESCGQSSMIKVLSGEYPDYNRVIPVEDKRACTGKWQFFNWTYLAHAQKAYADYIGKKDLLTIPFKSLDNLAYFNDGNNIEMIIMPCMT